MALSTQRLPAIRQWLSERDGPQCQWCGVTNDELAERDEGLTIDHIQPVSLGGSDEPENLQLLCRGCNTQKGSRDAEEIARPVRFANGVARAGFTVAHNIVLFNLALSPLARLLYVQLRHYAFIAVDAFPGQAELAANLKIGARMLRQYVRELEEAGLLRTERRGRGMTNAYVVLEPTSPRQDRKRTSGLDRNPISAQSGTVLPVSKNKKTEDVGRAKARPRDQLFDALALACDFNLSAMTKGAAKLCGIATAEIRQSGGTPEMMRAAVANYRRRYQGAAATPKAIANHWPEIVPATNGARQAACAECGVGGGRHLADCSLARPSEDATTLAPR